MNAEERQVIEKLIAGTEFALSRSVGTAIPVWENALVEGLALLARMDAPKAGTKPIRIAVGVHPTYATMVAVLHGDREDAHRQESVSQHGRRVSFVTFHAPLPEAPAEIVADVEGA